MLKTSRISVLASEGRLFAIQNNRGSGESPSPVAGGGVLAARQRHQRVAAAGLATDRQHSDLLGSSIGGLTRLCELAFAPTSDIHAVARRAVDLWQATTGVGPQRTVALASAVALYLELCRRDRAERPAGVLSESDVESIMRAAQCAVPRTVLERHPALRKLMTKRSQLTAAA
jgi:hypothetical protein